MVVEIYGHPLSAPYRIAALAAEAAGAPYELKHMQVGDHLSDWFKKVISPKFCWYSYFKKTHLIL